MLSSSSSPSTSPYINTIMPNHRYSRSCSALPKSMDHLSWKEALPLLDHSVPQSYLQEKMSAIQQKIQSLRLTTRRWNDLLPTCERRKCRRRVLSDVAGTRLLGESFRSHNGAGSDIRVQIASCLIPIHLDPPPPYTQPFSPFEYWPLATQSRSVILQFSDDELFLDTSLGVYPARPGTATTGPVLFGGTLNMFEMEHWARSMSPLDECF